MPSELTWEDLDALVEGDPAELRDRAWAEIRRLRERLARSLDRENLARDLIDGLDADVAALRTTLREAQGHTCPAPDWYPRVRALLGHIALAAAFTGTDLAELPAHIARLRERGGNA